MFTDSLCLFLSVSVSCFFFLKTRLFGLLLKEAKSYVPTTVLLLLLLLLLLLSKKAHQRCSLPPPLYPKESAFPSPLGFLSTERRGGKKKKRSAAAQRQS
jgi:hypothetical protein